MVVADETRLIEVAAGLIGARPRLSKAERSVLSSKAACSDEALLEDFREQIRAGLDPLGDTFCRVRSPATRRTSGATYTPTDIVSSMIRWAISEGWPARVVDPGAGSGRFLLAAGQAFPTARLVAVEKDPVAALMLRANLTVMGLTRRTTVLVEDYRAVNLDKVVGPTLFIGNPPYVRHHDISGDWKEWFARSAAEFGVKASKLAGLHLHFFIRTLQLAQEGDVGAFITSAEWLDTNYGSTLRQLLAGHLGGAALHVLEPSVRPFADATTTGAITCFRIARRPDTFRVRSVEHLDKLNCLSAGQDLPWAEVAAERRWSIIVRPTVQRGEGMVELGELCRVHRGQVTGANAVWVAGPQAAGLPASVLLPTVTKARDLISAATILDAPDRLRKVIDIPVNLGDLSVRERKTVDQFLRWAKSVGADQSYIASHRRAWWAVGLRQPAPIICTYMARRAPAFVRNLCGARHINIAHGLYPREHMSESLLDALAAWLRINVGIGSGRTYSGGLTKFEPKELERVLVPMPENLPHADAAARLDH